MSVHSSGEQLETVLAHLRAEEPLEHDPAQQALIRNELGVIEEQRDDTAASVREYLAACDGDPEYREPMRALVRIYRRKLGDDPSAKDNLGRLLEAMVDAAGSPRASAQGLLELAVFRGTVENDIGQAKACLQQAVEQDPQLAAAWLELEMLAAKDGDTEARMRALEARANLTADPTWQGYLLIELAEISAEGGDVRRASGLLDTVVALEGRARFRSRLALESIARKAGDQDLLAHALEGQAELIARAIDDPEVGAICGVPSIVATPAHAADAWLRAGEVRRRSGDAWGAVAALSGAAERLDQSALVARLRMAAADAAGDSAAAVKIARDQLAAGISGVAGAALWMRVGQAMEGEGELEGALDAYGKALDLDPKNVAALTLRTDLLAGGDDPRMLAEALEAGAGVAGSPASQARAFIVVAYVWAVRGADVARGRQALERAVALGIPAERAHRLARSFAALSGDDSWYADATAALHALVEDPLEKASLLFELGRMRMLGGDEKGAIEAFNALASGDGDRWLGRALAAYVVGIGRDGASSVNVSSDNVSSDKARGARDHGLVVSLAAAETDMVLGRGLVTVAAMIACQNGNVAAGMDLLQQEHEREPADVVVALFLANTRRRRGDLVGAASVLTACAASVADVAVAGSLQLEAGFLLWQRDKGEALKVFEQAMDYAPGAAATVLSWALRGARPDDPDARQRAIELSYVSEQGVSEQGGASEERLSGALERLGAAINAREGADEVRAALEMLDDINPGGDVGLAVALARVLMPSGDDMALEVALTQIEDLGGNAAAAARAERFRVARFVQRDATAALRAARGWAEVEPALHTCLEWLAAARAADDRDEEIAAREAMLEHLSGDAAVAIAASLAIVRLLHVPGSQPLLMSQAPTARLLNLELALPGGDPHKRGMALKGIGDALGDHGAAAARLWPWSDLATGAFGEAQAAFKTLVDQDPEDMAAWEGLRASSEKLGDQVTRGIALARLGNLCKDDERAASLWEQAGMVLLEHTEAHDDAEIAFQRALDRDRTRAVAFDKLFRRVRARNENDRLLKLIELRLEVTNDEAEITKMYWERARVYRDKGEQDKALKCLRDVTMLEPNHVGALALSGEIAIKKGDFAIAAPTLAKLATLEEAPKKQRLLSGIAAVDLYEKRLSLPDKALEVLSQLYRDNLSTLKVRERLARTAAKVGNWEEAVKILERLMEEREKPEGRAEAARLAMAIYRDKLRQPARASKAVARLLQEVPDDREAVELLLTANVSDQLKVAAVPRAKSLILERLQRDPFDRRQVELIADIAALQRETNLRRAALGVAVALGNEDSEAKVAIAEIDARATKEPQIVLNSHSVQAIADPQDQGPLADLFAVAAPVISEAMGPNDKTEGVGRRQRVDGSHAMRAEAARWMGALGFGEFEVYVGGKEPNMVRGFTEDKPSLIIGANIGLPLDAAGRYEIAREVFALRRGSTVVLHEDDNTVTSIVIAVCRDVGLEVAEPQYAMFREVKRRIKKAMSRKVRNSLRDICPRLLQSRQDAHVWAPAARRSIDRMALIAAGDAGSVLDAIVGPLGSPERQSMQKHERAKALLAFALSTEYLELRAKLGMGVP